ncbi:hypothetical protein [Tengunoibacter tsumagoiensis]|uniref:Lipoprotein n=1 Tax=Tengunoibacter tsumagoiensis TaxID=2014871 RepID=A0A402A4Z2_9CHLR|nr:hypothetical protein [Tengunoibacter tsumagoiensis]GCE14071.1 hypothetical protein KTT_39300 [Tengunoibacter tsumagoiensis]
MKIKQGLCISALMLSLTLLASCGVNPGVGASPTPRPKTAAELLQSSETTMNKLKFVHVVSNTVVNEDISNLPSQDGQAKSLKIDIGEKLDGDSLLSTQEAAYNLNTSVDSGTIQQDTAMKLVTQGDKVYVQNKNGTWYVLSKAALDSSLDNSQLGDFSALFALAKKGTLNDSGTEKLNGVTVHHLVVTLDKDALKDRLQKVADSLQAVLGQDAAKSFFDTIQLSKPTLDLWIDESTSRLYQSDLTYGLTLDLSSLATPTPGASAPSIVISSDGKSTYSNFDKKVTVTVPADAIPASSLAEVGQ